MAMNRRDTFKLAGVAAATVAMPSMAIATEAKAKATEVAKKASGKSVVIIGAGFGGLTMAKALRIKDKTINVTVIEKRSMHMACPLSNGLLGGLKDMSLSMFVGDYSQPATKYGYTFVNSEVTSIDRKAKTVTTSTAGDVAYDILVLSPGIAYDYEKQFPTWSKEKIAHVAAACPAALMPGNEHVALKRQLEDMDDGTVFIVPPPYR